MRVTIREEKLVDTDAIREVNDKAFGQSQEGRLVDLIRTNNATTLSLVAVVDDRVVGHILFSPVKLEMGDRVLEGSGLGPMSVLPEFQRMGIGSKLINEGISKLRTTASPFIVVLGHPEYYPRFGFVPASRYHVRCEWEVPDDVFMIMPLNTSALSGVTGLARYRDEFKTVA